VTTTQPLRDRVRADEALLGCFLTWPSAGVAELAAMGGFDFLVIDCEHGFFSIESVEMMIRTSDAAEIPAIIRAPSATSDQVGRYLDAGAAGTLFPRIDGAESARAAVANVKFAPDGRRGLGGVRANRYGATELDRFVVEQNAQTLVAVQIETPGALAELDGIASIPGVDVLYVGPNDLSQALGIPGQYEDPQFTKAVARVAVAAAASRRGAGIMLRSRDQIPALTELGYRFFTTSDRALVLESARAWRAGLSRP
jgi:2-keto-3-deoxy-L-rhamnonate aldolase RhmA